MQNDPLVKVDVDESEDTEWNDILRAHGVIPQRAPSPTAQLEEALEEALQKQQENRLDGKDLSDLEELEDDEDEEFLELYKKQRMAEIKKLHEKAKFGQVFHVNKPEYNKEITECSMGSKEEGTGGVYVFVHMSSSSKLQSRLLADIFNQAAVKFPQIKFVDIPANRAVENYPENNCPTLIVYYLGEVLRNFVTLLELGGNDTKLDDLEKVLVKVGAVDEKDDRLVMNLDDEDAREDRFNQYTKRGIKSGIKGKFNVGIGSGSEDEDFFD
ncbi:Plp2p LALA0_S04e01024g [Lachancea lanzarotensis]|uniref:LALA0S04e01024g1_1 n=1 Tax=Lachancea lanzarotensis TaxID=1245769 RepID=A0A0C7N1F7_9SACH|nr:uncharacterized protein LALA0_S04e01024g [Lachancea lanzarotensis]CEP61801.1 LALA0S04e01024g1_1 [Lachancea lanzarotensis]